LHPSLDEGQAASADAEGAWRGITGATAELPDWSKIKPIKRYFQRRAHEAYPAWAYHPTESARIVHNAREAAELGLIYREASADERIRTGAKFVWDWRDDSLWRPMPYGPQPRDLAAEAGKNLVKPAIGSPEANATANATLIKEITPAITAAVIAALKADGGLK
jgi:hypothetical protein